MRVTHVKFARAFVAASIVSCSCLGGAREANATLGGNVASVVSNQQRLGGTRQLLKLATGERHELQLPSGIVVHEYVSPSGVVYAITWQGPRKPDLRELLGPYFAQLAQRSSQAKLGHHRMVMEGADLVIESSGHRGSSTGRAWVPSLVPTGINLDTTLE
jgi:Protein of unknown function (DUF2844)